MIGYTKTANATLSGTNTVTVKFPTVPALTSVNTNPPLCDILRVDRTITPDNAPYLGNAYSVATNIACDPSVGTVVTYTDTVPTASLTVYTNLNNIYGGPSFDYPFLPGGMILNSSTTQSQYVGPCEYLLFNEPGWQLYNQDNSPPVSCTGLTYEQYITDPLPISNVWVTRPSGGYTGNGSASGTSTNMFPAWVNGQHPTSSQKGVIDFSGGSANFAYGPSDVLTLFDSNFAKSRAWIGNRAYADPGDTAIGIDRADGKGLAFRAAISHHFYINQTSDAGLWTGEITASSFTMKTSSFVFPNWTGLPVSGSRCIHVDSAGNTTPASADCNSNTGTVTSVSGDGVVTNGTITVSGSLGLANAPAHTILGNSAGSSGPPAYLTAIPNGVTATTQTYGDTSASVATDSFVAASVAAVPGASFVYSYPAGDIICASGNSGWPSSQNVSIGSLSISNITYSGGTFTFTTASGLQNDGYLVGQTVQVTGTTGGTGNFNAQYSIAGIASQTSFTATSGTATGTAYGSGGTVSMVCNNNSDVISFGTIAAFASTLSLPSMTIPTQYSISSQYELITPATAPTLNLPVLYYNGVSVASVAGSLSLGTSKYSDGSVKYTFTVPQTGNIVATIDSQSLSTSAILTVGVPPSYTATSASYPLSLRTYFSAAGVSFADTITYSSGGTSCTNGTQTVTFTSGGGAGATGTITVSGGIPSGAVTVTTPGYGYTSVPTTGTVATCSGATTFTSSGSLGGGSGTALRLLSFTAHN